MKTLLEKYLPARRPDDGTGSDAGDGTVDPGTATAATSADEPTNDNAPAELETPAIETEQTAEEFDTIELEGKQYQVPKALKPNFMLHADYTQKTQATAATAKELAAERERLDEQFKASEEELGHRAMLRQIDDTIAKYKSNTPEQWAALEQDDPQGWNKHQIYFASLKEQRQELTGLISQAEAKRTQEAQSTVTKRIEETQAHAMKIKGWSPQMDAEVLEYAEGKGFAKDKIAGIMTPGLYDIIRYAKLGEESEKRARNPNLPSVPAQPLTVVGAKKNPSIGFDPATADMDTYVAERKKQQAAKGR